MDYYHKYLKYKTKYLKMKNSFQIGGGKPLINILKNINLFSVPNMEELLNPIYGLYMCESGFVINNFYLDDIERTQLTKTIRILTKEIPGSIQPTNEIMINVTPEDIGRYAALLYSNLFYKINNTNIFTIDDKTIFNSRISKADQETLISYIDKSKLIKKTILKDATIEPLIRFHLLLYCLWWVSNNKAGIKKYYEGINQVFTLINNYLIESNKLPIIDIPSNFESNNFTKEEIHTALNNDFELCLAKIFDESFKIFSQEQSKHFCVGSGNKNDQYPDCGETTLRNFFNFLLLGDHGFDISLLNKFNPISELKEYYAIFNNFNIQSSPDKYPIYRNNLNARDAWSYLILKFANKDINFVERCTDNNRFELNAGMSLNGRTSNFFQAVKNLLPGLTDWKDLENDDNIKEIIDQTEKGFGSILIDSNIGDIKIHCEQGHYYIEYDSLNLDHDYSYLQNPKHKNILDILTKKKIFQ